MKKKLRDCTYGEVQKYCEKEFAKKCENCPLWFRHACELIDYPNYYEDKMLDIEIDIPNDLAQHERTQDELDAMMNIRKEEE